MEKLDTELKGRDFRRKVIDLLKADDFAEVLEIFRSYPARRVINPLFSCLCSIEPEIKWRAITALGVVVANLAQDDMESARVVMRRMIWNLNDESGGIGWGVPETMGEVMARHKGLAREYVNILVSYIREDGNFMEHEPLQQGVLWGLGRLAQPSPELLQNAVPHLHPFLSSENATLRGLAVWILGLLGGPRRESELESLLEDEAGVIIYLDGTETVYRVNDLAKRALAADV
ncbi:MAG: HEAT repeat domain-containing protein [Deltaproteobacteria bacterium]|nr:MAG: HEAT repeat domain-containing protein [Deltaproteobacteria bacterium]